MNVLAAFDPVFRWPFLTGLVYAAILPLLGMYLRLREEWLAALAFAQLAAAGSLAGAILGVPVQAGALALTSAAALAKGWLARTGNDGYALLMLAGWASAVLMLANVPIAEHLAHALFDGQLYFTGFEHLLVGIAFAMLAAALLAWLSRPLLLERMLPDFFRASGRSPVRFHLVFDLLTAAGLAFATSSVGVMAAFGLVFVPSLIAYRVAGNWRKALAMSSIIGVAIYLAAFAAALALDQPFGPLLVVTLIAMAPLGYAAYVLRTRATAGATAGRG
jgi:zinc transport system permease protein